MYLCTSCMASSNKKQVQFAVHCELIEEMKVQKGKAHSA